MAFSVTILGSSSAIPTSNRNLTAHLLNVDERFFLIDCGEGTQLQLKKYKAKFSRLDHIFITHLHGDHIFGLPGLISTLNLLEELPNESTSHVCICPGRHDHAAGCMWPRADGCFGEDPARDHLPEVEREEEVGRPLAQARQPLRRVEALGKFLDTDDGKNLLAGYKRATNIIRIEEKKDGREYVERPDPSLYRQDEFVVLIYGMVQVACGALLGRQSSIEMSTPLRVSRYRQK